MTSTATKTGPVAATGGGYKLVRILGRLTGGPARHACLLHERLSSQFETRLVIGGLSYGEHDMGYLLSSAKNVLRVDEMGRRISIFSDLHAFWKLFKFLRREKPELVHTHTAKAGALGRIAAWLAGVPVIVHTYHGHIFHGYFSRSKTQVYLAVERALGSITTQVVAISDSQRKELCDRYRVIPHEKAVVIQNGFEFKHVSVREREEAKKRLGLTVDAFVFVWAGRMAPVKDVELLGKVISMAAVQSSNAFFLVVGDGETKPQLESIVQSCDNVKLLGWCRDMDQIWRAADAAILTSRNEGTPTALIEAMATHVPFVATNVGGVQDLAVPPLIELPHKLGHRAANGFLVPRTPEALFHGIQELVHDRESSKKMGEIGNTFVRAQFSADRLVADLIQLYNRLTALKYVRNSGPVETEPTDTSTSDTAYWPRQT